MINKTRKHIWSVSLVMSIAIIGALAAFIVLASNPRDTQAHGEYVEGDDHCPRIADEIAHDEGMDFDHTCDVGPTGNVVAPVTVMSDASHASAPRYFDLEGLDNGARLNWVAPKDVATKAVVVGYYIDRDAWHPTVAHPINDGGDATIKVYEPTEIDYTDLGLAYGTTYSYKVLALVRYNRDSDGYSGAVAEWWNLLGCVLMNDVVEGQVSDGPAIGPDDMTSPYCAMYDGLSADTTDAKKNAQAVVRRTYDAKGYNKGEWSGTRTVTTADSGGRLAALIDPPTMVRMLRADPACANTISVTWRVPVYLGTVPEFNDNGVYVGPDYIGGERAGKEEVGQDATSVTYQVQRMVNDGAWVDVTPVGRTFTDVNVAYESIYKYRVRAMNARLNGPWTVVIEALEEPDKPQMPRSLNVDPTAANTVELEWLAPIDETKPLWRTQADFDIPGDASKNLQYQIERQVGTDGSWIPIATPFHQYGETIADHRTQGYTDSKAPAGNVSYRVAALVSTCNISAFSQKDAVPVVAAPLTLGIPASVTATSPAAGAITVSYTAGVNATGHLIILAQGSTLVDFSVKIDGSDASFSDVAAGNYTAIVVSFRRVGGTLEFKSDRSTVTVN